MKRLLHTLLAFIVLLLVLLAAAPGLLYLAGIARIHELPRAAAAPALSVEQQNWLRCELKAGDRDRPAVTDPWRLALGFLKDDPAPNYGDRLAWLVARDRSGWPATGPWSSWKPARTKRCARRTISSASPARRSGTPDSSQLYRPALARTA
jgi:hypothetical protein